MSFSCEVCDFLCILFENLCLAVTNDVVNCVLFSVEDLQTHHAATKLHQAVKKNIHAKCVDTLKHVNYGVLKAK